MPGSGLPLNRCQLAIHDAAKFLKVADLKERVQYCAVLCDNVAADAADAEGDEAATLAKRAKALA